MLSSGVLTVRDRRGGVRRQHGAIEGLEVEVGQLLLSDGYKSSSRMCFWRPQML